MLGRVQERQRPSSGRLSMRLVCCPIGSSLRGLDHERLAARRPAPRALDLLQRVLEVVAFAVCRAGARRLRSWLRRRRTSCRRLADEPGEVHVVRAERRGLVREQRAGRERGPGRVRRRRRAQRRRARPPRVARRAGRGQGLHAEQTVDAARPCRRSPPGPAPSGAAATMDSPCRVPSGDSSGRGGTSVPGARRAAPPDPVPPSGVPRRTPSPTPSPAATESTEGDVAGADRVDLGRAPSRVRASVPRDQES